MVSSLNWVTPSGIGENCKIDPAEIIEKTVMKVGKVGKTTHAC